MLVDKGAGLTERKPIGETVQVRRQISTWQFNCNIESETLNQLERMIFKAHLDLLVAQSKLMYVICGWHCTQGIVRGVYHRASHWTTTRILNQVATQPNGHAYHQFKTTW